jgi:hypothetical protein
MFRSRINARCLRGAVAASLAAVLAGCSDIYWDHRETVSLSSGDAIAANEAMQMIDPWPPQSGNTNLTFDGQKMQSAAERYRTNTVIPPINATTSVVDAPPVAQNGAAPASSASPGSATATAAQ